MTPRSAVIQELHMFLQITLAAVLLAGQSIAQTPGASPTSSSPSAEHTLDTSIDVPATGKPLPSDGKWSVSKTPPAACPPAATSCLGVLYRTPEDVICEWTVLLGGNDTANSVLEQNDDTSRYFLRRLTPQEAASAVLTRTKPVYPAIAQAGHISGKVELSLSIDPAGNVFRVVPKSGPPMLIGAASQAAKSWQFKPTLVGTRPVNAVATLSMDFSTQGPGRSNIKTTP
jgi:TonB family protein